MHNNLIRFGHQSQNIYENEQDTWQQRQEETYFTGNGSISGNQPQTQKYFTNQSATAAASSMPVGYGSPQIPNPISVINSFPTCATNFKGLVNNKVNMPSPSPSVNSAPAVGLGASILSQFLSHIQRQQLGMGANVLQENKSFLKINQTQSSPSDCDNNYYSFPNESYMTNSATSMTGTCAGICGMGNNGNTNNIDVMHVGDAMNSGNSLRTNVGNSASDSIGSVIGSNTNTNSYNYNSSNSCVGNTAGNFSSTSTFGGYTSENNVGSNNVINCGNSQNASTAGMGSNINSQNSFLDKYESVNNSRKRMYDAGSNHYKGTEMYYQSSPSSDKFENGSSALNHNHTLFLNPQNFDQWVFLKKKLKKSDDELAQYLFGLHNKGCFQCKNR